MERMKAAELLIEKIEKDYKDDIACVVIMGSTIYNDTHDKSDLDLYFIPKTERGYQLQDVFIIDGVGYDFWAVSWEFIEKLSNHELRITSILTEGKVLYYGDEEDQRKFQKLKERALNENDRDTFFNRVEIQLKESQNLLFILNEENSLHKVRQYAIEMIGAVTYGIALLNRTTIKRGRGKLKNEILQMAIVPKKFERDYDTVFISNEVSSIKRASKSLVKQLINSLQEERKKTGSSIDFNDAFGGYYEELINFYNKLERACQTNDPYAALIVATEITKEIENGFKGTDVSPGELPDLIEPYNPQDLKGLASAGKKHQKALLEILDRKKVPVKSYENFEELRGALERK